MDVCSRTKQRMAPFGAIRAYSTDQIPLMNRGNSYTDEFPLNELQKKSSVGLLAEVLLLLEALCWYATATWHLPRCLVSSCDLMDLMDI